MMEDEFTFWIENRLVSVTVNDEEHTLAHYTSNVSFPRPGNKQLTYTFLNSPILFNKNGKKSITNKFNNLFYIPESYFEDYTDANSFFFDEEERDNFYEEMNAGAESGWDYSSKWQVYIG